MPQKKNPDVLELVRGKLVWVEQDKDTQDLYLRALTDEPAEQAVQRAIMAVEQDFADEAPAQDASESQTQGPADSETPTAQSDAAPPGDHTPPIAIVELPAKPTKTVPEPVIERQSAPSDTSD